MTRESLSSKGAEPESLLAGVEAENDDEISKIMNEIQELQTELEAKGAALSAPSTPKRDEDLLSEADLAAWRGLSEEDRVSTLGSEGPWDVPSSEMPSEDALVDEMPEDELSSEVPEPVSSPSSRTPVPEASPPPSQKQDRVQEAPRTEKAPEKTAITLNGSEGQEISMTIRGSLMLNVGFPTAKKNISVCFSGDAIELKLSDGTEFRILVPKV